MIQENFQYDIIESLFDNQIITGTTRNIMINMLKLENDYKSNGQKIIIPEKEFQELEKYQTFIETQFVKIGRINTKLRDDNIVILKATMDLMIWIFEHFDYMQPHERQMINDYRQHMYDNTTYRPNPNITRNWKRY